MLQALQVEPLLTLDGVVEGPLTNFHDLQEGAQGRVRVAVLPKQQGGTGNRLLVIERDAARHSMIITLFVATAKNILTRGAADGSNCSDCYISRRYASRREQPIEGERNEDLTHVRSCSDRNSRHRFGTPEAQLSAPRPDAGSRLSVSRRVHSRHRCDRLCECRPDARRSSRSRARRYLCQGVRSEECRAPSIHICRR